MFNLIHLCLDMCKVVHLSLGSIVCGAKLSVMQGISCSVKLGFGQSVTL